MALDGLLDLRVAYDKYRGIVILDRGLQSLEALGQGDAIMGQSADEGVPGGCQLFAIDGFKERSLRLLRIVLRRGCFTCCIFVLLSCAEMLERNFGKLLDGFGFWLW